jgi:hypothetical protein
MITPPFIRKIIIAIGYKRSAKKSIGEGGWAIGITKCFNSVLKKERAVLCG